MEGLHKSKATQGFSLYLLQKERMKNHISDGRTCSSHQDDSKVTES